MGNTKAVIAKAKANLLFCTVQHFCESSTLVAGRESSTFAKCPLTSNPAPSSNAREATQ